MKDLVIVKAAHGDRSQVRMREAIQSFSFDDRAVLEKVIASMTLEGIAYKTLLQRLLAAPLGIDHFFCDGLDKTAATIANKVLREGPFFLDGLLLQAQKEEDLVYEQVISEIKDLVSLVPQTWLGAGYTPFFYETETVHTGKSVSRRDKELYPYLVRQAGNRNILFMGKGHALKPFFESRTPFRVIEITLNPFSGFLLNDGDRFQELIRHAARGSLEFSVRYNRIQKDDPFARAVVGYAQDVVAEQNAQPPLTSFDRSGINSLLAMGLKPLY